MPLISKPDPANMTCSSLKSWRQPALIGHQELNPEEAPERSPSVHVWWQTPPVLTWAHLQGLRASLSALTSGETCLPAVAALFIIKPGMFQCRMYYLALDKAWAQCCQPPSVTGMHLVLFCKEKGVFFDHKLAQAFRNWCRWWLGFVRLFKKWFQSTAFNLSIWTWVGFDTPSPSPLDVVGGIPHAGHLSDSLSAMETAIFPMFNCPVAAPTRHKISWKQEGRAGW